MLASALNSIIRFALYNRMLVAAAATFLLLYGGWQMTQLPIDVFPDLNRPRVVIMAEAHGMAPEEVETLIAVPIETALNGAAGVQAVRSSSAVGISVIYVEFDWGTEIFQARQIVTERLALVAEQLPPEVNPQLAPISSIMGQIVMVGMFSQPNSETRIAAVPSSSGDVEQLNEGHIPPAIRDQIETLQVPLGPQSTVERRGTGRAWNLADPDSQRWYTLLLNGPEIEIHQRSTPMEMRTVADWIVRQQLLTIGGVSQVFVMGGDRKQYQVLVDPNRMLKYGVTLHEIEQALGRSNANATGGYLDEQGPNEYLVRALGRLQSIDELREVVVASRQGQSIVLDQVARVTAGAQIKRGTSAAFIRSGKENAEPFTGGDAVVLTVTKQPGADTRGVTDQIGQMLADLQGRLAPDIRLVPEIYQQKSFIDLAIENVVEALRDGGLLVVIILFLFLLNFRTTFITLTAIPLSIVVTALVFKFFGLSINTMTLGGLAVAIGELVDDAIVDVENIFRRLKENRNQRSPKHPLLVVFQASVEIRNSIVFGTMIVVLVFLPLFALQGIEGRLFTPLGIAYIVSILSSLLVSLTVTPVLSYWLLSRTGSPHDESSVEHDSWLLRLLKWIAGGAIRLSLKIPGPVLVVAMAVVLLAAIAASSLQRDFLPPFNEGAAQINVVLPAGTSLAKTDRVGRIAEERLQQIPEILSIVRRTGRAELDEHAMGVNISEIIVSLDQHSPKDRDKLLDEMRECLDDIPGIVTSVEQPLAHLISHMLSGVMAEVAIKIYGDDLDTLRAEARKMEAAIDGVAGVEDLQIEQQTIIPQMRIEVRGDRLQQYGLTRADVTEFIETAMNGRVVSSVLEGQRKFDLLVRMDESYREDLQSLGRLNINLPGGGSTKLENVAEIYRGGGPNTINREQVRRRIAVQCNVSGRGLVDTVEEIIERVAPIVEELPEGYFVEYGGQFESQQSASTMITILFAISLAGMFLVLYSMFKSVNLALQVMIALPMAFIGSVAALYVTGQTLSTAAQVGFISLCGIASRNGILLINHYLHLVKFEGEDWTPAMIVRAGQERLAPVLMTALTSGIGLFPLALAAGEPGKEILYPVATVIIGGLITSTLLEFLVRPALFWTLGIGAAKRTVAGQQNPIQLAEEQLSDASPG